MSICHWIRERLCSQLHPVAFLDKDSLLGKQAYSTAHKLQTAQLAECLVQSSLKSLPQLEQTAPPAVETLTDAQGVATIFQATVIREGIETLIRKPGFTSLRQCFMLSATLAMRKVKYCVRLRVECFTDPSTFLIKENHYNFYFLCSSLEVIWPL